MTWRHDITSKSDVMAWNDIIASKRDRAKILFLFIRFLGSRKYKWQVGQIRQGHVSYVTLTSDLVRQGHLNVKVTYLISGPIHARDMNLFLFPWFAGSWKAMTYRPDTWPWRLTFVRKVDVTLQMTYLISDPIHARDS